MLLWESCLLQYDCYGYEVACDSDYFGERQSHYSQRDFGSFDSDSERVLRQRASFASVCVFSRRRTRFLTVSHSSIRIVHFTSLVKYSSGPSDKTVAT